MMGGPIARLILPKLREYQLAVVLSRAPDDLTSSAPQLGKSLTGAVWITGKAWVGGPGEPYWIASPTYAQTFATYSKVARIARSAGILHRHTETPPLVLRLINGAVIEGRSWEREDNLAGTTVRAALIDEFGLLTTEAYSILSARRAETISHGEGHFRYLGNVGEIGGPAEELWNRAEAGEPGFACRSWTWEDRAHAHVCRCNLGIALDLADLHAARCPRGRYLQFIARERSRLSDTQFRALYGAEWLDGNSLPVYASFTREQNVRPDVALDPHLSLVLACDFNVDPMAWLVGQAHPSGELRVVDELILEGGATTQGACVEFLRRYPAGGQRRMLHVYGDASGRSRKTSATSTDYGIIQSSIGAAYDVTLHAPNANPPVSDRVHSVNGKLCAADGTVSLFVHPRCKALIRDLARVSWKPGTRDIDKRDPRLTHSSDALGYWVHSASPLSLFGPVRVAVSSPSAHYHDSIMTMDS